jgi:hypothetical protein
VSLFLLARRFATYAGDSGPARRYQRSVVLRDNERRGRDVGVKREKLGLAIPRVLIQAGSRVPEVSFRLCDLNDAILSTLAVKPNLSLQHSVVLDAARPCSSPSSSKW